MLSLDAKLAFTFPGQGSFDAQLLRNLYFSHKTLRRLYYSVDEAAGDILGVPFLPVVYDASQSDGDPGRPDLEQLGIYLANFATARLWLERGLKPDLLLGHSFGELAALAVAGVYTFEDGARLVCQRVLCLREAPKPGRMAAVSAPKSDVEGVLREFASELSVSVVNHPLQTVVSGPEAEIEELRSRFGRRGVSVTTLKSRYPFHSGLLASSARTFEIALRGYRFSAPVYPVYLGVDQKFLRSGSELATALPRQLVTPLDFHAAVRRAFASGHARFVECGAGTIVSRIIGSILKSESGRREWPTFPNSDVTDDRLDKLQSEVESLSSPPPVAAGSPAPITAAEQRLPSIETQRAADSGTALVRTEIETSPYEPIAIVGMGCVLPGGANDPETFWKNIAAGVNGIVDLADKDPNAHSDFVAGRVDGSQQDIVQDKTYTLLNGSISRIPYDAGLLSGCFSEKEFEALTKAQKILALAMAQARVQSGEEHHSRIQCILGSTADGYLELDDACFGTSVREALSRIDASESEKNDFAERMNEAFPAWSRKPEQLSPHGLCASVAKTVLGLPEERTYLLDSACSSSLYSLALGARALRSREADLVYAGGVFAPGPANNTLFAQFRGLTPTGSKPFDASADGVVFGDGAGVLALKRLSDAVATSEKIIAVIRSEGLSSDGKSPAINVPQPEGQTLAIRAAFSRAAVDSGSIQYVEAHATATPVGDAVELKTLREVLPPGARCHVGSVKALIGHTGWTSGVASLIKICKALEHRRIPKQFNYAQPAPGLDGNGSGASILVPIEEMEWPANRDGLPRRAGLNGFGFGGTNAHLIVEKYEPRYHAALAADFRDRRPDRHDLVLVAAEELLPDKGDRFDRKQLRMPPRKLILPDVAEHMDASQYLATLAAYKLVSSFPQEAAAKLRIGVALGLEGKTERGVRANERIFLDRLLRVIRTAGGSEATFQKVRDYVLANVLPSGPYTLPGLMPNVAASRITHSFNWRGPNVVIDHGEASFLQSLDAACKFLEAGDCDVVLAGGLNAWSGHRNETAEAAVLLALATEEVAEKHNLPVLARISLGEPAENAIKLAVSEPDVSRRGATGALEFVNAVRRAASGSAVPVTFDGRAVLNPASMRSATASAAAQSQTAATQAFGSAPISTVPPAPAPATTNKPGARLGTYAYVEGTPITNYTQVLVEAQASGPVGSLEKRSYLFLVDQPEVWREIRDDVSLKRLKHQVVTWKGSGLDQAHEIDLSNEDAIRESFRRLRAINFDTIVGIKQLSVFNDEDFLLADINQTRPLLEVLFGACREFNEDLAQNRLALVTLCVGALRDGGLDGFTGLFGGFVKSVAREVPQARLKAVVTDEVRLSSALHQAMAEVESDDASPEVAYLQKKRMRPVLAPVPRMHQAGAPWITRDSVVLATGAGRGVTAVLAEETLKTHGCVVIALGRTDPARLPAQMRELTESAFNEYESRFYSERLAADPSCKIPALKRQFEEYRAAHELCKVIDRCRALPGTFEYIQCDISNPDMIDGVVKQVLDTYGKVDLLMHGAGVQVSKMLPRKALADFRSVVNTKLASLTYLYQAFWKRGLHKQLKVHLLTSAFSYLGNDGQGDYGAANETMNRLASRLNLRHPGCYWSSLGWLGWAGIGMTRGTEYAALAASRRLRGVTREEGQAIFREAMSGPPSSPVNILLADGEITYYNPAIQAVTIPTSAAEYDTFVEWPVSPKTMPFLADHVVRGVPTLPGSFIIAMAADAAHKLLPDLQIVRFERTRFLRLVRASEDRPTRVRALAKIVERAGEETIVRVQIVLDFVHKTGYVLGKDLLHTEIYVRMSTSAREPMRLPAGSEHMTGPHLPDPYVAEGSPVRLNGPFKTMKQIVVGHEVRRAKYKLNGNSRYNSEFDYLIPNIILVDAFWRFGTVRESERGTLDVYVPERCDAMDVFFDYNNFEAEALRGEVTFHGANPRPDGDVLHVGPIVAADGNGRVLLRVVGGVCRKFGEIEKP